MYLHLKNDHSENEFVETKDHTKQSRIDVSKFIKTIANTNGPEMQGHCCECTICNQTVTKTGQDAKNIGKSNFLFNTSQLGGAFS